MAQSACLGGGSSLFCRSPVAFGAFRYRNDKNGARCALRSWTSTCAASPPQPLVRGRQTGGPMDTTQRPVHVRGVTGGAGKGWARGKTATSDPRVARAAAAHLGLTYQRRTPFELLRWPGAVSRPRSYDWTPSMAYAVGLIATDGCLIERGRAIAFVSRDAQLVETLLLCLGREPKYRTDHTRSGQDVYRIQTKDAVLYRWLEACGLTPRKSLTLGAIRLPEPLLPDLVRGLLDGDGSIINKVRADTSRRSDYWYEWLRVQFVSASREHIDWLHGSLRSALGLRGWVGARMRVGHHPTYQLGFAKYDSITLLAWLYALRDAPCLLRKRAIWDDYALRHPDLVRPRSLTSSRFGPEWRSR